MTHSIGCFAKFNCSIHEGLLLWFINDTHALSLPRSYNISYVIYPTVDGIGERSTLQILALRDTNNSRIQCAIDPLTDDKIQNYSQPAFLQGNCHRRQVS